MPIVITLHTTNAQCKLRGGGKTAALSPSLGTIEEKNSTHMIMPFTRGALFARMRPLTPSAYPEGFSRCVETDAIIRPRQTLTLPSPAGTPFPLFFQLLSISLYGIVY